MKTNTLLEKETSERGEDLLDFHTNSFPKFFLQISPSPSLGLEKRWIRVR